MEGVRLKPWQPPRPLDAGHGQVLGGPKRGSGQAGIEQGDFGEADAEGPLAELWILEDRRRAQIEPGLVGSLSRLSRRDEGNKKYK